MSKSYSQKIFNTNWHCPISDIDYKLEIYSSSGLDNSSFDLQGNIIYTDFELLQTNDSSINYITFNAGSVSDMKGNIEFQDGFGLSSLLNITFTFQKNLIPDDLVRMLNNPFTNFQVARYLDPDYYDSGEFGLSAIPIILNCCFGNVFKLYIKINGVYQLQWTGCQKVALEGETNPLERTKSVEVINLGRVIAEQLPVSFISFMKYYKTDYIKPFAYYADWFYNHYCQPFNINMNYLTAILPVNFQDNFYTYFWFISYENFFAHIDRALTWLTQIALRSDEIPVYSNRETTSYYKQSYTGEGRKSDLLSFLDLYLNCFAANSATRLNTFNDTNSYRTLLFDGSYTWGGSSIISHNSNNDSCVQIPITNGNINTVYGSYSFPSQNLTDRYSLVFYFNNSHQILDNQTFRLNGYSGNNLIFYFYFNPILTTNQLTKITFNQIDKVNLGNIDRLEIVSKDTAPASNSWIQIYSIYACKLSTSTSITYFGGLCENGLENKYNSIWDFYQDYYKSNIQKALFSPLLINGTLNYVYGSKNIFDRNIVITLTPDGGSDTKLWDIIINEHSEIVQKVSAQVIETSGYDITQIEVVNNSSRSEKSISIPIIFNNGPAADQFWEKDNKPEAIGSWQGHSIPAYLLKSTVNVRFQNLYYFDKPSEWYAEIPIRVHEQCKIDFGNGISNQNYFVPTDQNFNNEANQPPGIAEAIQVQQYSGKSNIIAHSLLQIFSNNNQTKLKGTCNLKTGNNDSGYNFWLCPIIGIIGFNLQQIEFVSGEYDNYPSKFIPLKIDIDFKLGLISCESLGITNA
jgi:hypothetical protein